MVDGRDGKAAEAFLGALCVSLLILAAMMADGSLETLVLIRGMDSEALPLSDLCTMVQSFLDRIVYLFHHRGCFVVEGHVKYIMGWRQKRHFYMECG